MTLGMNRITLQNEIINHLSNQSGLMEEAIDKIANAVADAIEQNNRQIESQLRELGVLRQLALHALSDKPGQRGRPHRSRRSAR